MVLVFVLAIYEINLSAHRSVYLWDESIYANNATEMAQNKQYLVYTVQGQVDHFNSKPPLVLWLQALSYGIFGYNEFAVRFPSYLALIGTLLLCIYYSKKLTGSPKAGFIAALTLLVAHGIMRCHVFLSGDLDGVLVLFTTAIFFHHLKVIQDGRTTNRDIYTYSVLFILAYLTKSTAVLLITPSIFLSLLLNKQLKEVLWRRAALWSALLFIGSIAGYYLIREHYDPGYWKVVWYSEFTRIAVNIQPWVAYPWNAYFLFLWERFFHYPLLLLAITGPVYLILPSAKSKKLFLHALLLALIYLVIISIPPVKLEWYDAPAYPVIALALGLAFTGIFDAIGGRVKSVPVKESIFLLLVGCLLVAAFIPFNERLKNELATFQSQEETTNALNILSTNHPETKRFLVIEELPGPNYVHLLDGLFYYKNILKANCGVDVSIRHQISELSIGDTAILCRQAQIDSLNQRFSTVVLDSCRSCKWIGLLKSIPHP